jgi:hypothetical protein
MTKKKSKQRGDFGSKMTIRDVILERIDGDLEDGCRSMDFDEKLDWQNISEFPLLIEILVAKFTSHYGT